MRPQYKLHVERGICTINITLPGIYSTSGIDLDPDAEGIRVEAGEYNLEVLGQPTYRLLYAQLQAHTGFPALSSNKTQRCFLLGVLSGRRR